ncbi:VirB3 family type IV secretion system protein [Xenorhabdus bovienii]|uniref:VirB3 family type IV secretion system protein n=1 Tax=Xenorhabdus bovienii TaxID=40576 RepID=UPI0023B25C7C|nr:VirB3 family type IV secretion system protein [Xenorhabdus bovienii]MDE9544132.1 VirB3 family type IV secretion system protein [Xenorhabdus bovienii]
MSDYQENEELKDIYLTYNGLNRPALVMGVPIILLLSLFGIGLITAMVGVYFLGLIGFIPAGICFLCIMIIRLLTESDSNALKVISFKLKGFVLKAGNPVLRIKG